MIIGLQGAYLFSKSVLQVYMQRRRAIPNENMEKLAGVVLFSKTPQNLVISCCCFAEDAKEMYKDLQRTCTAIACSLILLFSDVLVAVVVVLCSSSLLLNI